jgi:hypothetical protein
VPGSGARCHRRRHFVLCDFGQVGKAFVETDPARGDREHVIEDILSGELSEPVRVIALRADGTWRDVSAAGYWSGSVALRYRLEARGLSLPPRSLARLRKSKNPASEAARREADEDRGRSRA